MWVFARKYELVGIYVRTKRLGKEGSTGPCGGGCYWPRKGSWVEREERGSKQMLNGPWCLYVCTPINAVLRIRIQHFSSCEYNTRIGLFSLRKRETTILLIKPWYLKIYKMQPFVIPTLRKILFIKNTTFFSRESFDKLQNFFTVTTFRLWIFVLVFSNSSKFDTTF